MDLIRTPLIQELQTSIKITKESSSTTSLNEGDWNREVCDFLKDDAAVKRFAQHQRKKTRIHRLLQCCDQFPAISPDNPYLITWKIMIIAIILFYFLELPVYVFFGSEVWVLTYLYVKELHANTSHKYNWCPHNIFVYFGPILRVSDCLF